MSATDDLQIAVSEFLATSRYFLEEGVPVTRPHLGGTFPIVKRREKNLANEIVAASEKKGIAIFVMPPLPTQALQGVPFFFVEKAELRISIIETVPINRSGKDAWDVMDDVATALQWQPRRGLEEAVAARMVEASCDEDTAISQLQAEANFAPLFALNAVLAHPLQLAPRPAEKVEDPNLRIIDVLLNATYQLNPPQA